MPNKHWITSLLMSFRKRKAEQDLSDEMRFHLEKQTEINMAAGMSAEGARRQAQIEFGGMQQTREAVREESWTHFPEVLLQDIRYASRILRKSPGFTAVAVATLALGIGANTAIFSLLDSIMLKALPVAQPERLVSLSRSTPGGEGESFSYPQFEAFTASDKTFSDVFAFAYRPAKMVVDGQSKEVAVQMVSGKYFSGLGVSAAAGRALTVADDQRPQGQPVAVISQGLWNQLSRDPGIVGKRLEINGSSITVVGVMPPGFFGASLDYSPDVWLPLRMQPAIDGSSLLDSPNNWLVVMARLQPGISMSQAGAQANVVFQGFLRATNADQETLRQRVEIAGGGRPVGRVRQAALAPFVIMMVITGLVLLIACTNIANLLLARTAARRAEMATRSALGASRGRLIRQLLTEGMLLTFLGGIAALVVARFAAASLVSGITRAGGALSPEQFQFHPSLRILVFTGVVSILAGLFFSVAPSLQAGSVNLVLNLKEGHQSGGSSRLRWNKGLLIGQVAVCLPVLVAAGLFIRSFQKLVGVDLGFEANSLIQMEVKDRISGHTLAQMNQSWDQVLEKLSQLPGVEAASMSQPGFFVHSSTTTWIGKKDNFQCEISVTPGFFRTMQVPLVRGRTFSTQENTLQGPPVTILNEALAHSLFPGVDPLGQHVPAGTGTTLEVIGIVKDTKYESLFADAPPIFYLPLAQATWASPDTRVFDVRTSLAPATMQMTLQQAVESVHSGFQVDVNPMEAVIGRSLLVQRLIAQVTGFFGGLSLLLAAVGLYGLLSYMVAQRTREIGIRIALGAQRTSVVGLMLRETGGLVLIGGLIGLAMAAGGTRLLGSQLFGLTAIDPLSFGGAIALLFAVALLAGYGPARRASRVDPIVALRHE